MQAGKAYNIRPTGPSDIRRVEAGILNWGADMTLENNVYEVGLDYLVDASKRVDYIGREALERIMAQGVKRKLAGIAIEGSPIEMNAVPWAIAANGSGAGRVTSALYSPRLKKNIGYAMMPVAHAILGTTLTVIIPGVGTRKATVVSRPFIDPNKDIPKS
jgi:aminomethyltransferase